MNSEERIGNKEEISRGGTELAEGELENAEGFEMNIEKEYITPFSEGTQKLRRNLLVVATVDMFIGITNHIPVTFSMIGMSFEGQSKPIGLFILIISSYYFLHFTASSLPEIAKWWKTALAAKYSRKEYRSLPTYDPIDEFDLPQPADPDDLEQVAREIEETAQMKAKQKLRVLYMFRYLHMIIDVIVPYLYSIMGLGYVLKVLVTDN